MQSIINNYGIVGYQCRGVMESRSSTTGQQVVNLQTQWRMSLTPRFMLSIGDDALVSRFACLVAQRSPPPQDRSVIQRTVEQSS